MEEANILQTLVELKKLIYDSSNEATLQQVQNKDIVLFMGNTRAGKSTIVNYAIGNPLKSEHVTKNKFRISNRTPDYVGPVIGLEAVSETTLPSAWTSNTVNGLIVDAPGFDDNRGEAQDIANVYHIKNILTSAQTAKIVLICDIKDIVQDNVSQFLSLVDKVKIIFPNITERLHPGIIFVFNKDYEEMSKEEVCDYLENKIISQSQMKVNNREMIRYLSENLNQIVLIRMPNSERDLDTNDVIFDDLINAINNVSSWLEKSLFLNDINYGMSDKSKAFLYSAHTRLTEHQEFENFVNTSLSLFNERINQYDRGITSIDDGIALKSELNSLADNILSKIERHFDTIEALQALQDVVPECAQDENKNEIMKKIDFIKFVDKMLNMDDSRSFASRIKAVFPDMRNRVLQKICIVQDKIDQLQREEHEKRRLAEEERIRLENEEIERLRRESEEQQRRIQELQHQQHHHHRRNDCVLQ